MMLHQYIMSSDGSFHETTDLERASLQKIANYDSSLYADPEGVELIKHFESVHDGDKNKPGLQPQMDPVGIWTVGYGHALRHPNGKFMQYEKDRAAAYAHKYANLTEGQASQLLQQDLIDVYLPMVYNLVPSWRFYQVQLGALAAFAYNCGTHYKSKSGKMVPFAIWQNVQHMNPKDLKQYWETSVIRSGGKVLNGLIRRRKAEYYLFANSILKYQF